MMLNIGTWKNMSALSSSASPGRGTASSGYLPQFSIIWYLVPPGTTWHLAPGTWARDSLLRSFGSIIS